MVELSEQSYQVALEKLRDLAARNNRNPKTITREQLVAAFNDAVIIGQRTFFDAEIHQPPIVLLQQYSLQKQTDISRVYRVVCQDTSSFTIPARAGAVLETVIAARGAYVTLEEFQRNPSLQDTSTWNRGRLIDYFSLQAYSSRIN